MVRGHVLPLSSNKISISRYVPRRQAAYAVSQQIIMILEWNQNADCTAGGRRKAVQVFSKKLTYPPSRLCTHARSPQPIEQSPQPTNNAVRTRILDVVQFILQAFCPVPSTLVPLVQYVERFSEFRRIGTNGCKGFSHEDAFQMPIQSFELILRCHADSGTMANTRTNITMKRLA